MWRQASCTRPATPKSRSSDGRPGASSGPSSFPGPRHRLAFGAWALGGRGWGSSGDESERLAAAERALEAGVAFFDTAPTYGNSEALLGRMLKGRRDSAAIATKVGPRDDPRTSLESSLRRLDTGHVELLQLHEVAEGFEQRLEAMTRLMEEGKASAIGMCNAGAHQLAQGLSVAPLSTCQSPYNLFDRDVEHRDLEFCGEHGLAFLAYRPLAAGLLGGRLGGEDPPDFEEGDHRRRIYWFKGAEWERRHSVAERLRPLAADLGLGLPALALGWVLAQPGVSVAIAGARTAGQVDENLSILGRPLDPEHVKAIDSAVAEVFRPAKAGEAALAAASGWGERERFIVEHLDGRTTADGIARQWPEWEERPLITAQVKVFVDSLVEQGLVSYER